MAGLLAQTVSTPGPSVFSLLAGTFVVGIVFVQLMPETTARKRGARRSLLPECGSPFKPGPDFVWAIERRQIAVVHLGPPECRHYWH
jgi:hypothetical protein